MKIGSKLILSFNEIKSRFEYLEALYIKDAVVIAIART